MYEHRPQVLAARHPPGVTCRPSSPFYSAPRRTALRWSALQHNHAHIASCWPSTVAARRAAVLGIALDGPASAGDDGTLWGGEFLIRRYRGYQRAVGFPAIAMECGVKANPRGRGAATLLPPGRGDGMAAVASPSSAGSSSSAPARQRTARDDRSHVERGLNCAASS